LFAAFSGGLRARELPSTGKESNQWPTPELRGAVIVANIVDREQDGAGMQGFWRVALTRAFLGKDAPIAAAVSGKRSIDDCPH